MYFASLFIALFVFGGIRGVEGKRKDVPNMQSSSKKLTMAQRAFVILHVNGSGYLLMKAYKPAKKEHFQLPGGRIDRPEDFEAVNVSHHINDITKAEMLKVARHALLRELKEELSQDFSKFADRIVFLEGVTKRVARREHKEGKKSQDNGHVGHHPRKFYFLLNLAADEIDLSTVSLSHEHIDIALEPSLEAAVEAVRAHSGGDSAEALVAFQAGRQACTSVYH